ncbi:YbbR-like domain-containing protein [uncultured Eubacterium sp.]|uniref:CdaR family protein n=1 Tax=uncultured Eubacterium sp. TaxID=165185 RepID=UPI002591C3FE|nr:CdaR family protein [uncultured Eubacterium sp.]
MLSRKGRIVISLVVALALWAYVVGVKDPEMTRTYRNIPIRFLNEQTLTKNELAVLSKSVTEINVTLRGTRSSIHRVKESDILATVNLSGAQNGTNSLRIVMTVPDNVRVSSRSSSTVIVKVEHRISQEKPVRVSYLGNYSDREEPTTVKTDPDTVVVSGAVSLVTSVDHVTAEVRKQQLKEKESDLVCPLNAVDRTGAVVSGVKLSKRKADIRTVMYQTKTVSLDVPVIGENEGEYHRIYKVPKTITVKGAAKDLEDIDHIRAEKVDLSKYTSNSMIQLRPILPKGVQVSDQSRTLMMELQVEEKEDSRTKTLSFRSSDVDLRGIGVNLEASVSEHQITVAVTGSKEDIEKVGKSDISLYADLDGLAEGSHTVVLHAETSAENCDVSPSPDTVRVRVTRKEDSGSES